jgi:hypothetical protein
MGYYSYMSKAKDPMTEMFGDPISVYTDDDALEDGMIGEPFPAKFGVRVFLTVRVHEAIEAVQDDRTFEQRAIPLIQDALLIVKGNPADHLWTEGLGGNVTGKDVWIGANGSGGITLMFPDER